MTWQTIQTRRVGKLLAVTLARPERHNAINRRLLEELHAALDQAEADPQVRVIALEGQGGVFCTGLDFEAFADGAPNREAVADTARFYYRTLLRFRQCPKLVACRIDGRVQAGGVGLVAACDYAICSPRATFQLSEVLLGLLPATVMPFLVRRVGPHAAFRLTLTAHTLDAGGAARLGLVDESVEDLEEGWRRFLLRGERLSAEVVGALKSYCQQLDAGLPAFESLAVARITDLLCTPTALARMRDLQEHGLWQGSHGSREGTP